MPEESKKKSQTKVRTEEDVTPEVADEIIAEVIDLGGRRNISLPDGRDVYIRMPNTQEETWAEQEYAQKLFELKAKGIPFIAEIARMVLKSVENSEDFGRRERRVLNQDEIEQMIEANKTISAAYNKEKKSNPELVEPERLEVPPIVDEGSESLREILESLTSAPFAKTEALINCLNNTEYSNLVIHSAEYQAGRSRNRLLVAHITELGTNVEGKMQFSPLWKKDGDEPTLTTARMSKEAPENVGFLEGCYLAFQQEVLSRNFLLRLSSVLDAGNTKNSSEST
jgi:hypothetical protein